MGAPYSVVWQSDGKMGTEQIDRHGDCRDLRPTAGRRLQPTTERWSKRFLQEEDGVYGVAEVDAACIVRSTPHGRRSRYVCTGSPLSLALLLILRVRSTPYRTTSGSMVVVRSSIYKQVSLDGFPSARACGKAVSDSSRSKT